MPALRGHWRGSVHRVTTTGLPVVSQSMTTALMSAMHVGDLQLPVECRGGVGDVPGARIGQVRRGDHGVDLVAGRGVLLGEQARARVGRKMTRWFGDASRAFIMATPCDLSEL